MLPEPTLNSYLMLGAVLFAIGAAGVFLRRSLVTVLLSIEVMLAGVGVTFVAADRYLGRVDGQILAVVVMIVAACQAVAGLGVAIVLIRQRNSLNPDEITDLKW
ncbi:MAG: NADH-quinone oxidoreductase subunit NuoK [Acidobacteria bacterium]|nr:NADH-quinone oxidoreductase subunit NuoK [Acidobacteriota bacterium]